MLSTILLVAPLAGRPFLIFVSKIFSGLLSVDKLFKPDSSESMGLNEYFRRKLSLLLPVDNFLTPYIYSIAYFLNMVNTLNLANIK